MALEDLRPQWTFTAYGAFCPSCDEHIGAGTEDFDWGCSCCGYPDKRAVADWHAGFDHHFPKDTPDDR